MSYTQGIQTQKSSVVHRNSVFSEKAGEHDVCVCYDICLETQNSTKPYCEIIAGRES